MVEQMKRNGNTCIISLSQTKVTSRHLVSNSHQSARSITHFPDDSNIPLSDVWVEGARDSLPKEQFWLNLHATLCENIVKEFHQLLEDDAQILHLKDIVKKSISQARTETFSPHSSDSNSSEGNPIPLENMDTLQEFCSLSNFVGVDFQDTQVSGSDQDYSSTANPLPLGSVEGQAARFARRVLDCAPPTMLELATNVTPDGPVDISISMPMSMPIQTRAVNDIEEHPPSLSKETIHELGHVPSVTDPTFLTLFDGANHSVPENSYDLANEPLDALPIGQGDLSPSYLYAMDNAEWDWWSDLPS
jgi:hypothetical protein